MKSVNEANAVYLQHISKEKLRMNDTQKTISYIQENKKQELLALINGYIGEVKTNLHNDDVDHSNLKALRELSEQSGRIATIISEYAMESEERYLFNGGYLAALVEEFQLHLDKLDSISEFDMVYKKNIGKSHWEEIIRLLYENDIVQNKTITEKTGVQANYLNKIMKEMLDSHCVIAYEYSKYKYYSLSWPFKKYLDSIHFTAHEDLKVRILGNNNLLQKKLEPLFRIEYDDLEQSFKNVGYIMTAKVMPKKKNKINVIAAKEANKSSLIDYYHVFNVDYSYLDDEDMDYVGEEQELWMNF